MGGAVITDVELVDILAMYRNGKSIKAIARELGISINTVRKYLRAPCWPHYTRRKPVSSQLDPYKEYLQQRLRASSPARIPARVLLNEIRKQGYTGQITILRNYLSKFRNKT